MGLWRESDQATLWTCTTDHWFVRVTTPLLIKSILLNVPVNTGWVVTVQAMGSGALELQDLHKAKQAEHESYVKHSWEKKKGTTLGVLNSTHSPRNTCKQFFMALIGFCLSMWLHDAGRTAPWGTEYLLQNRAHFLKTLKKWFMQQNQNRRNSDENRTSFSYLSFVSKEQRWKMMLPNTS